MKYGIQTGPQEMTWGELLHAWTSADDLGLDSAWVYDHVMPFMVPDDRPIFEAWTSLAALAQATRRIEIGTMVTANTFRHPGLLAKMAATVDHVSGGRLTVGLGTGSMESEHLAYGIPLPKGRERAERLEETIEILRGLWTQERFSFDGKYTSITDAPLEPKPVQDRGPRIMVGGKGERFTLPLVARHADHWNFAQGSTVEAFSDAYAALGRACEAEDRDVAQLEISMAGIVFVSADRDDALARARALAARYGWPEERAEAAFLIGTPEEIRERIDLLGEAGVQHFVMRLIGGANLDDVPVFANEVARASAPR